MAWAGSVSIYANPFGSMLDGYQQGVKDSYDRVLKSVQIQSATERMKHARAAAGRAADNHAWQRAHRDEDRRWEMESRGFKREQMDFDRKHREEDYALRRDQTRLTIDQGQENLLRERLTNKMYQKRIDRLEAPQPEAPAAPARPQTKTFIAPKPAGPMPKSTGQSPLPGPQLDKVEGMDAPGKRADNPFSDMEPTKVAQLDNFSEDWSLGPDDSEDMFG